MKKAGNILGIIAITLLSFGIFFKTQHWPGASMFLVLSIMYLVIFYIPMSLIIGLKKSAEKIDKLYLICESVLIVVGSLSFLFTFQHWLGGVFLKNTSIVILYAIYLPAFLYKLFLKEKDSFKRINVIVKTLLILMLYYILVFMKVTGSLSSDTIKQIIEHKYQFNKSIERLENRNELIVQSLTTSDEKNKGLKVKLLADTAIRQIDSFYYAIVSSRQPELPFEKREYGAIAKNTWIADSFFDSAAVYSVYSLKNRLIQYRKTLLGLIPEDSIILSKTLSLNLDDVEIKDGEIYYKGSWEDFYLSVPFINVMNFINNLKSDVRHSEAQVLNFMLLSAGKGRTVPLEKELKYNTLLLEKQKSDSVINFALSQRDLTLKKLAEMEESMGDQDKILIPLLLFAICLVTLIFIVIKISADRRRMNKSLESQNKLISDQNKEISDSITYARRIQNAILPSVELIYKTLENSFVLYKPKDVVSGDFYAFAEKNGTVILAAVDCTGHGVPGAFMSMIGHNLINEIVLERGIIKPSDILQELNKSVRKVLRQEQTQTNDGMDAAICCFNLKENKLSYSGAHRPLWLFRDTLLEFKPTKASIGGHTSPDQQFENHEIDIQKGDALYIFTDGLADQFGGKTGKKMMTKHLKEKIESLQKLDMLSQEKELEKFFEEWKGNYDQVDDVLMIGIKL